MTSSCQGFEHLAPASGLFQTSKSRLGVRQPVQHTTAGAQGSYQQTLSMLACFVRSCAGSVVPA